jgi:outer membrane protein
MLKANKIAIAAIAVAASLPEVAFADGMPRSSSVPASDPFANFQIKVGATGTFWNGKSGDGITQGGTLMDGWGASTRDTWAATASLAYFFNPRLSAEFSCCSTHASVGGEGLPGDEALAKAWAFTPTATLRYHFDAIGPVRPYVGGGVQYMHFISAKPVFTGYDHASFKDNWSPVVQAGFDVELGRGWSVGFDAKYAWQKTDIALLDSTGTNAEIATRHTLDPVMLNVNLGYRFNLDDVFRRRATSYQPLK